jgi:hypothetical protein
MFSTDYCSAFPYEGTYRDAGQFTVCAWGIGSAASPDNPSHNGLSLQLEQASSKTAGDGPTNWTADALFGIHLVDRPGTIAGSD